MFANPIEASKLQPYAIVVASSRRRFIDLPAENREILLEMFAYQIRIKVEDQVYYRLALGNFNNSKSARVALHRLQKTFPDAWIYRRVPDELAALARFLRDMAPANAGESPAQGRSLPESADAAEMLARARQEFIDGNFARVIAITDKVLVIGNLDQVREALELAGITRERESKFAQAVVLYQALLDTNPPEEVAARIESRLEGIRTMDITPKEPLAAGDEKTASGEWKFRGFVHQFYRDDRIEPANGDAETVVQELSTNVDLFVQRRGDSSDLTFRLDAGLTNDFIDDDNLSRVSIATAEYARDSFRLVGGRQRGTQAGVYGRFDGLSLRDLSHSGYSLGFAYGYLVQSSYDGLASDRPFVGASLGLEPYSWLDLSLYITDQEISGLTDRQAVGSEIRYKGASGFAYGIIDYDVFYNEFNNLSLISNYRYDERWSFNLNLARGYTPMLSTLNALQGQAVDSIDDLKKLFSDDEIYDLARDRTSRSTTVFFGASYQLDLNRYLYLNYSYLGLDETTASGGVEALPSSDDTQLTLDYYFRGLVSDNDYATIGGRVSESPSRESVSVNMRTRIIASGGTSYETRVELDQRTDKNDDSKQLIVKPSLTIKYRASRKLSLESWFGIEYSDFDLPELDKQYTYSFYLGYYYLF